MTTSEQSGTVRGGDAWARAVRLSGVLAECGVSELAYVPVNGTRRELAARSTDLPAVIAAAKQGDCLVHELTGFAVTISPNELSWRATDVTLAEALRVAS